MTQERSVPAVVQEFMGRYAGKGVVGVSGGADSVALLRALLAAGREVAVVHVHHGLRGEEADADEAFVRTLCERLGVPYECRRVEVPQSAGVEVAGRRARYAALAEAAERHGASWVATAHTADDQAETILHRLIRGAGLTGLRGMPAERPLPLPAGGKVSLVRPLLTVRRQQVCAYLRQLGQEFREDSSNRDPRFTRNRIRNVLLPLLESFNPRVVEALHRLGEQVAEAEALLEKLGQELLARAEKPRAGAKVILEAAVLEAAEPFVQRRALRSLWRREGWPLAEMDYDAWRRVAELCRRDNAAGDFPGGVHLRRRGRVVQLWRLG